jgi:hypothetical protein
MEMRENEGDVRRLGECEKDRHRQTDKQTDRNTNTNRVKNTGMSRELRKITMYKST